VSAAISAVIAAVTSLAVAGFSFALGDRQQRRSEERKRRQELNSRYLNPLRFHLVENYFGLMDTLRRVHSGDGRYDAMDTVTDPAEISGMDAEWFNGTGCALASSLYLTGCLFAQLKNVRDEFPYLRLEAGDDTQLAVLLLAVQQGYLRDMGIYLRHSAQHWPVDVVQRAGSAIDLSGILRAVAGSRATGVARPADPVPP
jgi:hypothetical protein